MMLQDVLSIPGFIEEELWDNWQIGDKKAAGSQTKASGKAGKTGFNRFISAFESYLVEEVEGGDVGSATES